jgi:hypothetical protein
MLKTNAPNLPNKTETIHDGSPSRPHTNLLNTNTFPSDSVFSTEPMPWDHVSNELPNASTPPNMSPLLQNTQYTFSTRHNQWS